MAKVKVPRRTRMVRWLIVLFSATLLLSGVFLGGVYFYGRHTPIIPTEKFDLVFKTLSKKYYDQTFRGYNWKAVGQTFRAKVPKEDPNDTALTDILNNQLFPLLETSHLEYVPAWLAKPSQQSGQVRLGIILPELREMAGLILIDAKPPTKAVLLHVESGSFLDKQGIRPGLPIDIDVSAASELTSSVTHRVSITYNASMPDGTARKLNTEVPVGSPDAPLPYTDKAKQQIIVSRLDDASIDALQNLFNDPSVAHYTVAYLPCGLTTSIALPGKPSSVINVVKDSPADQAGIEPGSSIVALKTGLLALNKAHVSLEALLPSGIKKTLDTTYEGDLQSVSKPFSEERSALMDGPVLILRFNQFNDDNARWLDRQLRQHQPSAIVLDLRYNSGGGQVAMQKILAEFLPSGTPIATLKNATEQTRLLVPPGAQPLESRLVVLIGPASSSAAEVTASVLKHYSRAKLVGLPTAGDVMSASSLTFRDGSILQIPVATVLDPSGVNLERVGVTPDIIQQNTLADIRRGRDAPLECAKSLLAGTTCP
ncbi:S41 family peptidase [Dyella nitratireducens]|uniref:Tail specific protease domain-containing protein n=1 Tax=Dyella nitratireducens TaxID=1849580 RepID=A0ABQ1GNM0_9GAMM|nr:S41 family peptidase [Dyella nitratireducens]GGA47128.1 hypothetical protein GCM10010981_40400 [Dyella nitratireducens]GLQ41542.1 hypothetical protein GCM10007902_13920 [Dyella nitratireducens]